MHSATIADRIVIAMRWIRGKLPLRRYPELLLLDSEDERWQAWEAAKRRGLRFGRAIPPVLIIISASVPLVYVRELVPDGPVSTAFKDLIAPALMGPFVVIVALWASHRDIKRNLRQQLYLRGVLICLKCGYSLRGLPEPRCPECGTEFDPRRFSAASNEGNTSAVCNAGWG